MDNELNSEHRNVRSGVLAEADTLINGDRQKHYGTPQENFAAIAQMWSAYLGTSVSPADVCNLWRASRLPACAMALTGTHRWTDAAILRWVMN